MELSQTVRFVHHATRTEVAELTFPIETTVGKLKSEITRHLYKEETCRMRLFWEWYVDPGAGKVMTEITEDDHGRKLREFIPEDYTVLCLKGPVTDSAESLGQVVGRVGAEMREIQLENACLKKKINELEQRVASVMFPCHVAYLADRRMHNHNNSTTQEWNQIMELKNAKRNAQKLMELQPLWPSLTVALLLKPLLIETDTEVHRFDFAGWGLFVILVSSLTSNLDVDKVTTAFAQLRTAQMNQRHCYVTLLEWFSAVELKPKKSAPMHMINIQGECGTTFAEWLLIMGIMFHLCGAVIGKQQQRAFATASVEEALHLIVDLGTTLPVCNTEEFATGLFKATPVDFRQFYLGLFDQMYHTYRSQKKQLLCCHLVKLGLESSGPHNAKEFTDRLYTIISERREDYPFTLRQQTELMATVPSVAALKMAFDDVGSLQPNAMITKWLQRFLDAFRALLHCKDFLLWVNDGQHKFWGTLSPPQILKLVESEQNGVDWVELYKQSSRYAFLSLISSIAKNQCFFTDGEFDTLMENMPEDISDVERTPPKNHAALLLQKLNYLAIARRKKVSYEYLALITSIAKNQCRYTDDEFDALMEDLPEDFVKLEKVPMLQNALLIAELNDSKAIALCRLDAKKPFPRLVEEVAIELEFSEAALKVLAEEIPKSLLKIKSRSPPSDLKALVAIELQSLKDDNYRQAERRLSDEFIALIISLAKNECRYTDDMLDALMEDLPEDIVELEAAPLKHQKALLPEELNDSKAIAQSRIDAKKPFPHLVKEVAIELEFSEDALKVLEEEIPKSLLKIKSRSPPSNLKYSVTKELKSLKKVIYNDAKRYFKKVEIAGSAKKLFEYQSYWPSVDKLLALWGKPLVIETDTEIIRFDFVGWGLFIAMLRTVPTGFNTKDANNFTASLFELFKECLVLVKSELESSKSEEDKQRVYSQVIDLFSVVPQQVQPKHAALFLNCCNNIVDWLLIAGIMCHLYGGPINEMKRKIPLVYTYSALESIYSLIGKFSTTMPACNTAEFAAWVHYSAPADLQNQLLGLFSPKYVTAKSQEKSSLSFSLVNLSLENNLAVEQSIGVLLDVIKAKKEDHPFTVGQQIRLLDATMYPNETTVPSMLALKISFDPYLLNRGDIRKEKARELISYWVRSNFTNFVNLLLSPEFLEWAADTQKDFWAAMVSNMPWLWRNGRIKGVAWLGQLPDETLMALMTEEPRIGGVQSALDILMLPHNKGWAKRHTPERQKTAPLRIAESDKSPAVLLALMRPLISDFGRLTIAGSIWLGVALTAKDIHFPASQPFSDAMEQLITACNKTPNDFQLAIIVDIISESALKNRMATPELGEIFLGTHGKLLETNLGTEFKTHRMCAEVATKVANFTKTVLEGSIKEADEFLDRYQQYSTFTAECQEAINQLAERVKLLKKNFEVLRSSFTTKYSRLPHWLDVIRPSLLPSDPLKSTFISLVDIWNPSTMYGAAKKMEEQCSAAYTKIFKDVQASHPIGTLKITNVPHDTLMIVCETHFSIRGSVIAKEILQAQIKEHPNNFSTALCNAIAAYVNFGSAPSSERLPKITTNFDVEKETKLARDLSKFACWGMEISADDKIHNALEASFVAEIKKPLQAFFGLIPGDPETAAAWDHPNVTNSLKACKGNVQHALTAICSISAIVKVTQEIIANDKYSTYPHEEEIKAACKKYYDMIGVIVSDMSGENSEEHDALESYQPFVPILISLILTHNNTRFTGQFLHNRINFICCPDNYNNVNTSETVLASIKQRVDTLKDLLEKGGSVSEEH